MSRTSKQRLIVSAAVAACVVIAIASVWPGLAGAGRDVLRALWIVPALVTLHLGQLFVASVGWRTLFTGERPGLSIFYRLRIMREGIDSLLPVAQVGGEIVAAGLLAQAGVPRGLAGASIIVDVTFEVLTQVVFLGVGLCGLASLTDGAHTATWLIPLLAAAGVVAGLLVAQRVGLLRVLEALLRGMARRWPALAGASVHGLHAAALGLYRDRRAVVVSTVLHLLAWALGSVESWAVLTVLGVPVSPLEAFTIESLGMAARSAGFALPGAIGVQEGGFILAAGALGVAAPAALALSLVKRVRETVIGLIGIGLWRFAARRPAVP